MKLSVALELEPGKVMRAETTLPPDEVDHAWKHRMLSLGPVFAGLVREVLAAAQTKRRTRS